MDVNQEAKIDTKITKVNTNDFELSPIKAKIAEILESHNYELSVESKFCRSLKCKCITSQNDFAHSHSNTVHKLQSEKEKKIENDVSNVCLTVLRYLILDEQDNISSNLHELYKESVKFLDKERGPDETMVEVMYPAYVRLFDKKCRQLKMDSNYTDTFQYDQRITDVIFCSFKSLSIDIWISY